MVFKSNLIHRSRQAILLDHFGGFDASGNTCSLIGKLGQTWRDVNINNMQNMEIFRPFNRQIYYRSLQNKYQNG